MDPICPYLGLFDDPKSRKLFPTSSNACHQAQPPRPLTFQQQHQVCLTLDHRECDGFNNGWEAGFPPHLHHREAPQSGRIIRRFLSILGGAVLGFTLILVLGQMFRSLSPSAVATLEGGFQVPDPTRTPTIATRNPDLLLPVSSVSTPTPTLTQTPTVTPTLTPGPALLTPFGSADHTFVVYQIQQGDALSMIAERFDTAIDTIRDLNRIISELPTLWADEILVICVGCRSDHGLPPFTAIYLEEHTTLSALADRCTACDPEDLRRWNGLGARDLVLAPRWVILPAE